MKKDGFFKTYYKNVKELNVSLIILIAMFFVIASGVTSYALFGTSVVGDETISLSIGLPKTDDACFDVDAYGTLNNFKCYENNPYGLYAVYDVVIPKTVGSITVNEISDFAFESKGINSVVIPSSVTKIGNYAFNYNNISVVIIPSSVTSILDGAFNNNKLTSVYIKGKISTDDFSKYGTDVFGSSNDFSNSNIFFKK